MTRTAHLQNAWNGPSVALLAGLLAWLFAATPMLAQEGYSYLRTVEGYVNVESAEDGSLEGVENQPLIPGDRLVVGTSSRVEVVMSDGALLRVGGGELRFDSLALTPDTGDTQSRVALLDGEVQVVLFPDSESPLEIETANATLYLEAPGEYLVAAASYEGSSVTVREGFAEAQTDRGSAIVRSGEVAYIDGDEWATVDVSGAGRLSRLENWGDELDAEARLANVPHVEPGLRYRAARLANHGAWIDVSGRWGWRPHVTASWRPYVDGAWRHTPSGLTWVSNEPWGWVPSHYGSWDLVPGYGWMWFTGARYSPASVYWYWGPTHVAWVPAGYYTSFYSPHRYVAPRFGVYGWAGGDWGFFANWTFCPTRYFGRGRYNRYFRSGHEVARHASYRSIPRGVIATDTRPLGRDVWGQPDRITERLVRAESRLKDGALPDVTDFVARRKEVRPEIAEIVRPQEVATLRAKATQSRPVARNQDRLRSTTDRRGRPTVERRHSLSERSSAVSRRSRPSVRDQRLERTENEIPGRSTHGRPSIKPSSEARERRAVRPAPPTSERGTLDRSRVRVGRPSATADVDRQAPAPSDDRAVVRRVIDQMRSRQAPAPSRSTTRSRSSERPPRATSSDRSRETTRSRGSTGRSSGSRARSSSGGSRPPKASSSSNRSSQRRSARSRSSSRKPPGSEL